ncbi:MAG: hypothetical protein ACRECR_04485, partial [Thermoplasmata archaeon]
MTDPAEAAVAVPVTLPEGEEESLARSLGVDPTRARALRAVGLATPEAVRSAGAEELQAAGLTAEEIDRLHAAPAEGAPPGNGASAAIVARWARTVHRSDRP